MALHTFVVGFGRAGGGLHLPVVRKLRADARAAEVLGTAPIVVFDPATPPRHTDDVLAVPSIAAAGELLDPRRTVVHVCVPPRERPAVVRRLARAGFTKVVLEKPLACHRAHADDIAGTVLRHGMDAVVVAHWHSARLTARLARLIRSGDHGPLRAITLRQHKPRLERSLRAGAGDTAFDVEVPHGLGLALSLAGPASLTGASCTAARCDGRRLPWLGSAELVLRHDSGVRTHLASDLTAPIRQRSITLRFDDATVTGHYPVSAEDSHARLTVRGRAGRSQEVFRDDALTAFLGAAYRYFAGLGAPPKGADLGRHAEIVRILTEAKERCGVPGPPPDPRIEMPRTETHCATSAAGHDTAV
ncbi:Gfo/Idh/MocA family oxidoreductase [Amycolatopsis thermalba]|uniref:Gfo/Idh/MocA family oxidoreductase n=1 Tax=Amycolatopsis thermalba TaxID=944492 RepID=A0ABY4NXJ5_9PSEU|nr:MULTISPECIES: Gfo/Idh/MocA family oxidoreductase [Amycolatopsis]UQS24751.1 Gfo/Idh/MocA family oxidoreductase [Amycolatopsis thermalba]